MSTARGAAGLALTALIVVCSAAPAAETPAQATIADLACVGVESGLCQAARAEAEAHGLSLEADDPPVTFTIVRPTRVVTCGLDIRPMVDVASIFGAGPVPSWSRSASRSAG